MTLTPGTARAVFDTNIPISGYLWRCKTKHCLRDLMAVRSRIVKKSKHDPIDIQFVGSRAAINIMTGERYKEVTDQVSRSRPPQILSFSLQSMGRSPVGRWSAPVNHQDQGTGRFLKENSFRPRPVNLPQKTAGTTQPPTVADSQILWLSL